MNDICNSKENLLRPSAVALFGRKVRLCIFDFDLTLADGSPWIVQSYREVLSRNGLPLPPEQLIRSTIGMTVEASLTLMTGLTDPDEVHRLRMEFKAICRPGMAEQTRFFPDAARFVRLLAARGCPCAIVSTKEAAVIRRTIEAEQLADAFPLIVGLEHVSEPKPSPEGLRYVLRHSRVQPAEALYFGDNPVDGAAAQAAGVPYVGVCKGVHPAEALARYPHVALLADYDTIGLQP